MIEIRYNKDTGAITGWCADSEEWGKLKPRWGVEAIIILDIPIPEKPMEAYLYDDDMGMLIDNPDYVPSPDWDAEWQQADTPGLKLGVIGRYLGWQK